MYVVSHAIKFRINQEIKFLYKKKKHLNQQLYQTQMKCANQRSGMWQHIQNYIDQQINKIIESQYKKLNNKLDILNNQNPKPNTIQKEHNFQPRIINLSDIRLTKNKSKHKLLALIMH